MASTPVSLAQSQVISRLKLTPAKLVEWASMMLCNNFSLNYMKGYLRCISLRISSTLNYFFALSLLPLVRLRSIHRYSSSFPVRA